MLVGYEELGAFDGVSHRAYMRLSGAVFTALLGTDTDADVLEESWTVDCKGKAALDANDFFEAVFELADIWCQVLNS